MIEATPPTEPTSERFPSGVPGLDLLLGGGFLKNGTYIIMGPPGAGKTILGNQICFHHVANGGRALYVTLLAESHSRMLSHLKSLRFFDPTRVADPLNYISGYRVLEEQGLSGLLDLLRKLIREQRASLLVIDGLVSAHAFANTELGFKKFIHELNTLVSIIGCTTFLLTSGPSDVLSPEHTMVDGLVELSDTAVGVRSMRMLSIRKFRGSDHLRGKHVFQITSEGIVVHPRLEALITRAPHAPAEHQTRLAFGIPAFDEMLGGGVLAGSMTMLLGSSGCGKTTLGLSFLAEGGRRGEPGLYYGFFEGPPRLIAKGDGVGLDVGGLESEGLIGVEWQPAAEFIIDEVAEQLLATVRKRRLRRLFIDGAGAFRTAALFPKRLGRFFVALSTELRALGVTTVFAQETRVLFGPGISVPVVGLSAVAENIVFLRQVEHRSRLKRVISIVKTRESAHQSDIREFTIGDQGVEIGAPLGDGAEAILTGIVRTRGGARTPREVSSTEARGRRARAAPSRAGRGKKGR